MFQNLKISTKLIISFFAVVIFSVSIIGYFSYQTIKNSLKNQILNDLILVAEAKEGHILQFLNQLKSRTIDFSSDGFIRDSAKKIIAGDLSNVEKLNEYLIKNKMLLDSTIHGINILNLSGKIIASTKKDEIGKNELSNDDFLKIKNLNYGEAYLSNISFKNYNEEAIPDFTILAPLIDKNTHEKLGIILLHFKLDKLNSIINGEQQSEFGTLSGQQGRGETLEIYLVNQDGLMMTESKFFKNALLKLKVNSWPVKECKIKKEINGIYKNYRGQNVVGASMCLPNDWTLLVEISEKEVFFGLDQLKKEIALSIILILIIVWIIVYFSIAGIMKPLKKLSTIAKKINQGNFDLKVKADSQDEVGQLAESFNQMTGSLINTIKKAEVSHKEFKIIKQLFEVINKSQTTQQFLDNVLNVMLHLDYLPIEPNPKGCIFLANHEKKELILKANFGVSENFIQQEKIVPFGECLCGQAVQSEELYISDSCYENENHTRNPGGKDSEDHGHYILPLKGISKIVGVMSLYTIPHSLKNNKHENFIKFLSNQIGRSLETMLLKDALREGWEKFRLIFEGTRNAIFWIDPVTNLIINCNKSAEILLEKPKEEIIGFHRTILHPSQKTQYYTDLFKKLLEKDGTMDEEGEIITKSGKIKPVQITTSVTLVSGEQIVQGIFRDITSRKQIEKELKNYTNKLEKINNSLKESKAALLKALEEVGEEKRISQKQADDLKKFELAVENVSDHIIITDPDGVIIYANQAAENITGYLQKELIGQNPAIWGKQMNTEFYQKMWETIKTKKKTFKGELINKRKNQEIYTAEVHISPILDKNNNVIFFVGIENDITKAKEIDYAKNEFVSLASHQLRTPLSTINWYTEMLLAGDVGNVTEKQKDYLEKIYRGNQRMITLVNALLNVSQIELGTFAMELQSINLLEIADSVVRELSPQINNKSIELKKNYAKNLLFINADPKFIRIVFQNLLTNAINYSKENSQVNLTIENQQKNILIKISDMGYGIPQYQQEKIFTKLFRADNVRKKDTTGTGLGLYIVKAVVEQSGGKIWFESKEEQGTTFFIEIPLKLK